MSNVPFINKPVNIPSVLGPSNPTMNCPAYVSWSVNGGSIIKRSEKIPGYGIKNASGVMIYQPEFDVYDATNVCPAMYLGTTSSVGSLSFLSSSSYTLSQRLGTPPNYSLYRPSLKKPYRDDLLQGNIGSCVLEAVLSGIAFKSPDFLMSGIIQDPNFQPTPTKNQYYIRFFYKNKFNMFFVKISTDIPLLGPQSSYSTQFVIDGGKVVIWPSLITKAYAIMINYFTDFMRWSFDINDPVLLSAFKSVSGYGNSQGYNLLWGVNLRDCLSSICGPYDYNNVIDYNFSNFFIGSRLKIGFAYNREVTELKNFINGNKVVIAQINDINTISSFLQKYNNYSKDGIFMVRRQVSPSNVRDGVTSIYMVQHAYAVLSIDQNDLVTIKNPYSKRLRSGGIEVDYQSTNGLCTIPLSEFLQLFVITYTDYSPDVYIPVPNTQEPFPSKGQFISNYKTCESSCSSNSNCKGFVTEDKNSRCYLLTSSLTHPYPTYYSNTFVKMNTLSANKVYSIDQKGSSSSDLVTNTVDFVADVKRCVSSCNSNNSCVGLALADDMSHCYNLRSGYRSRPLSGYNIWKK